MLGLFGGKLKKAKAQIRDLEGKLLALQIENAKLAEERDRLRSANSQLTTDLISHTETKHNHKKLARAERRRQARQQSAEATA